MRQGQSSSAFRRAVTLANSSIHLSFCTALPNGVNMFRLVYDFNHGYAFREPSLEIEPHSTILPSFSGHPKSQFKRCSACGELLDKWASPLRFSCRKKRLDIGVTFDGIVSVSETFKSIYEAEGLSGLTFRPVEGSDLYSIVAGSVVRFDSTLAKTRFGKQCGECGSFDCVAGADPVALADETLVPDAGIVRTDVEFGSYDEKSPVLVCGDRFASVVSGLKGLGLLKI